MRQTRFRRANLFEPRGEVSQKGSHVCFFDQASTCFAPQTRGKEAVKKQVGEWKSFVPWSKGGSK